jgi:SAM-dependent methyltransferase
VSAIEKWKADLASWAIPAEILDQAEVKPWIHPPALFALPQVIKSSPSHQKAQEALPAGGSILDIGCGGGVAAFGISPQAGHVIGVDQQQEMLDMFAENARSRGVSSEVILGDWPDVAEQTPIADVVTVHHVVYNVGEIKPFIEALDSHARKRVVLELPRVHPMSNMAKGWKHFWNLERPTHPTSEDFLNVLTEMGIKAHVENFVGEILLDKAIDDFHKPLRIRLCLPESRDAEVKAFYALNPPPTTRELAVIWWDK